MSREGACPCCGQPWPKEDLRLDKTVGYGYVVARNIGIQVSPDQADLLQMLAKSKAPITMERLISGLYGLKDEPNNPRMVMRTQLARLRKKLKPTGYEIKSVGHNMGYILRQNDDKRQA